MLELYRKAIALRPSGAFAWLDSAEDVLAFERDGTICMVNLGKTGVALPPGDVVLSSDDVEDALSPSTAAWIRS